MANAQEWLNEKFPNETEKEKVRELIITHFTYGRYYNLADGITVGRGGYDSLFIRGNGITYLVSEEEYLSSPEAKERFPKNNHVVDNDTGLFEWVEKNLIDGSLEIKNFPNLEELIITYQDIDNLKISGVPRLRKLTCAYIKNLVSLELECSNLNVLQINYNPNLRKINLGLLPNLTGLYFEETAHNNPVWNELAELKKTTLERKLETQTEYRRNE